MSDFWAIPITQEGLPGFNIAFGNFVPGNSVPISGTLASNLSSVPWYHIVDDEGTIREMTQSEKDAVSLMGEHMISNAPDDPRELDFRLFGLHKKEFRDNAGYYTERHWYKDYDEGTATHSNLAVKETFTYDLNVQGLITKRTLLIEWYLVDGTTVGCTKTTVKHYTTDRAIIAAEKRRHWVVAEAQMFGLVFIAGEYAPGVPNSYHFLQEVKTSGTVDLYISGITSPLVDFIDNSTETYMTQTIKDGMTQILDYQGWPS